MNKMRGVKELEENKEIDWLTFVPRAMEEIIRAKPKPELLPSSINIRKPSESVQKVPILSLFDGNQVSNVPET